MSVFVIMIKACYIILKRKEETAKSDESKLKRDNG